MRTFSALSLLLACAACSAGAEQPQAGAGAQRIECALGAGAQFAADCLVERTASGDTRIVTVRHPDGGFRRFEQVADGRGLVIADGADVTASSLSGGVLEIAVAQDRYRFPVTPTDRTANNAGSGD
ncbi:hypothetical protein [Allopontixanthobacter sp.]|uniref:hypothetical protein n=1 Tax=Allopontixanthobacter sp. TaxID=2906452 RepID=UPI002ABD0B92|nr:hypothetical protein [Allopontixanthobacter sp.]MDZ4308072.1 hypothetical protein [Allopontixanthobacter sp.]